MTALVDPAPAAAVKRPPLDRWDRYVLPDPDTGQVKAWTRVTTLAGALDDRFALSAWENRMVAKGMAMRPDLVALAANLDVEADREQLGKIANQAKEAAGSTAGANLGTALHRLLERADAGLDVEPGNLAGELAAYRAELARRSWRVDPRYIERIVCVPELGVAGQIDRLLHLPGDDRLLVADVKSQKSLNFGSRKIAIQLAVYSRAYAVWNAETETWEDPPAINQDRAAVLWVPIGQGRAEVYSVDLAEGWRWALVAREVYQTRRVHYLRPWDDDVLDPAADRFQAMGAWAERFRSATSVDELMAMATTAAEAFGGQLPEELKVVGRQRRAELQNTATRS